MDNRVIKIHIIYGGLLVFTTLVSTVAYMTLKSHAANNSVSVSVGINNSTPTIDSVYVNAVSPSTMSTDSSITLVENSTKTIYINGQFSDLNGCQDVASSTYGGIKAAFYTSDAVSYSCSADDNNCYQKPIGSCTISGCDSAIDTTGNYSCDIPLKYYADRTDNSQSLWYATAFAYDDLSQFGSKSATTEVNGLISINVPASISYGFLAVGATSLIQTSTFTNYSNTTLNPTVLGTQFNCTTGTIAVGQQLYSSSSAFASTSSLSVSPTAFQINLYPYKVANPVGRPGTTSTYWRVDLPSAGGYAGTCNSTVTVTAAE